MAIDGEICTVGIGEDHWVISGIEEADDGGERMLTGEEGYRIGQGRSRQGKARKCVFIGIELTLD